MAMFLQNLGPTELILILLLVVLLFGAKKLPALARSMGKSIKEFKKGAKGVSDEPENSKPEIKEAENKPAQTENQNKKDPDADAG